MYCSRPFSLQKRGKQNEHRRRICRAAHENDAERLEGTHQAHGKRSQKRGDLALFRPAGAEQDQKLGGDEQSTHKYVSELLGRATIDTNTYGWSDGMRGRFSTNDQVTGRKLMTADEIRMLGNQ